MAFRSKSAQRVVDELSAQSKRYCRLDFECVDNILDMRYFDELLPALKVNRCDYSIFYETKANLTKEKLKLMRDAGIRSIQPGIDSLEFENSQADAEGSDSVSERALAEVVCGAGNTGRLVHHLWISE